MQPKKRSSEVARSASAARRNCDCMMRPPICGRSRRGPSGTKCSDSNASPCHARWIAEGLIGFAYRLYRTQIEGRQIVANGSEPAPCGQSFLDAIDSD